MYNVHTGRNAVIFVCLFMSHASHHRIVLERLMLLQNKNWRNSCFENKIQVLTIGGNDMYIVDWG